MRSTCIECGATMVDSLLRHTDSCSASKPTTTTLESRMPAIQISFDNPEEQKKFLGKLKATTVGNGLVATNRIPESYELAVEYPTSPNPSPSRGLAEATSESPNPQSLDTNKLEDEQTFADIVCAEVKIAQQEQTLTSVLESTNRILAEHTKLITEATIKELEKAHRAGGTTDFDNATDEWIDDRIAELTKEQDA